MIGVALTLNGADFGAGLGSSDPIRNFFHKVQPSQPEKDLYNAFHASLATADAWDALVNFYPFHGATAALQKWNLRDANLYPLTFVNDITDYHTSAGYDLTSLAASTTSLVYADTGYKLPVGAFTTFAFGALNSNSYANTPQKRMMSMFGGTGGPSMFISRSFGTPITTTRIGDYANTATSYDRTRKGFLGVIRNGTNVRAVDDTTVIATTNNTGTIAYQSDGVSMSIGGPSTSAAECGGGLICCAFTCNSNINLTKYQAIVTAARTLQAGLGRVVS